MIESLLLLLACQLFGEVANHAGLLPLPGPVTGLGVLFAILCWRGGATRLGRAAIPPDLAGVADALLRHLALLYVPASVGIMQEFDLLRAHPLAIVVALVASTAIAQAATALVFERLLRRRGDRLTGSGQLR